jgi:peptide/nickel transport system ATP-binding protein
MNGVAMASETDPIVSVQDLSVVFGDGPAAIRAVDGVSLDVCEHDIYAVVGESGCGKSTLAYSLLNLVPQPGRIAAGQVRFDGRNLAAINDAELNRLRAADIAIVFQAAMNAFNPVLTIGRQVEHILAAHPGEFTSNRQGREHFTELLRMVRLPAEKVWGSFESQLSGGMKQRVAIAVALLLHPRVLILDEPTTALDVLNQRLVIDILKDLKRRLGLTIIFVTHDLAVVAELATRVAVMYAGRLVDVGSVAEMFSGERRHPYVTALIDAIPSVASKSAAARPIPGQVPNLSQLPPGCRFAPRCTLVQPRCHDIEPTLLGERHRIACHVVNNDLPASEGARS